MIDLASFFKDARSQRTNWIEIAAAVLSALAAIEAMVQAAGHFL